jgi:hypothetical protein
MFRKRIIHGYSHKLKIQHWKFGSLVTTVELIQSVDEAKSRIADYLRVIPDASFKLYNDYDAIVLSFSNDSIENGPYG